MNARPEKTARSSRIIGGLIALMMIGLLAVAWKSPGMVGFASGIPSVPNADANDAEKHENLPRLRVSVANAASIKGPELHHRYRGEIIARRDSSLAMRRGGRLKHVAVHEGDLVRAGEVLAEIDVADLDAAAASAVATLASAQAALDEATAGPRYQTIRSAEARVDQLNAQLAAAKNRFQRQQTLVNRGAGNQQELDDAAFTVDELIAGQLSARAALNELQEGTRSEQIAAARARVESARAAQQRVEVDRSDSQIVAPYDGVVAIRMIDEGTMVGSNQPVLRILEVPPVHGTFGVPADVADQLKVGDSVAVSTGESGLPSARSATIVRMRPQVDPVTRTRIIEVKLSVPEESTEALTQDIGLIGKTATLWVPWERTNTERADWLSGNTASAIGEALTPETWIPTAALVRGVRGLWSVYVAVPMDATDQDDLFAAVIQRRDVRVLRTAGQMSMIAGQIQPLDWIVVDGTQRAGPGVAVTAVINGGIRSE